MFKQAHNIRQWGLEETLKETGMINKWKDLTNPISKEEPITCQIELFYRKDPEKRKQNEKSIKKLLKDIGGKTLSSFIDMPNIAFHAVKAQLPAKKIKTLLRQIDNPSKLDIQLFNFPGIMYFRPTGQSITVFEQETIDGKIEFPKGKPKSPPVVAILDGAPQVKHSALNDRILLDDPDNLSSDTRQLNGDTD